MDPSPDAEHGFELGTDGARVIVVGVDGSETSVRAGAYAAGMARRQGADLVVVLVTTTPAFGGMAPEVLDAATAARVDEVESMRQQVDAGAAYVGVPIEFRAMHGDPFTELCKVAAEVRADAVVVGASSRIGHRVAGSMGVKLVKAGRWPVVVVP